MQNSSAKFEFNHEFSIPLVQVNLNVVAKISNVLERNYEVRVRNHVITDLQQLYAGEGLHKADLINLYL